MDQTKTGSFKKRLDGELKLVEQELKSMGRQNPANPGEWDATPGEFDESATEPDEVADRVEEYEENRAEIDELEKRWHDIKRALGKLDEGTYGVCEVSGEPIEADRLDANPSARTCKAHLQDEDKLPE